MSSIILSLATCVFALSICSSERFTEILYPTWGQSFSIAETLAEEKTEHQDLILFSNAEFGRVLALDGAIQLCEKDEFIYHEMLVHVPLFSHDHPKSILIIGGGDGGIAREVLKHPSVEKVVMVELDPAVVKFSEEHLPFVSQGCFKDPRMKVVFQDGSKFVKETQEAFDVILCDSTDPFGAAACLFTEEFYNDCKHILKEKGIFSNQSGVPFMQPEELLFIHKHLSSVFENTQFYFVAVPSYTGGLMALGFASSQRISLDMHTLIRRSASLQKQLKYYTPQIHLGAFAMPAYIQRMISP